MVVFLMHPFISFVGMSCFFLLTLSIPAGCGQTRDGIKESAFPQMRINGDTAGFSLP